MIAKPDTMLYRAAACTRQGWPVFPARPGSKEPAIQHGFHDASTDDKQIRSWWTRQTSANVAIATRQPGPDVLDIDQHGQDGNGFAAYHQLSAAGLLDGTGAVVATLGGGLHLYFCGSRRGSGGCPATTWTSGQQAGCVGGAAAAQTGLPDGEITRTIASARRSALPARRSRPRLPAIP